MQHTKKETRAGLPSYSFAGDADTGVHSSAANTLSLMAGGVTSLSVTDTACSVGGVPLSLTNVATLAAAGANQGNAAAIAAQITFVTGSDGTKGVILPAATAGAIRIVYNTVAASGLKVYPATGDDVNDGTANAAVTIEGKTMAIFVAMDTDTWGAVYTADT